MAEGTSQDRGELPRPHPGCYFFFLVWVGANVIFVSFPTMVIGFLLVLFVAMVPSSLGSCPRGCAMAPENLSNRLNHGRHQPHQFE